jgi:hypothetical protein
LVDKFAGTVPTWKASLLKKSGRLVYLDSKLAASPIYHMLSLDLPPWFFNVANKLLRGFFWSAEAKARRGQCVVAWKTVCSPKDVGGLGIKNLQLLNHALRMRWRWLALTDDQKPWQGLEVVIAKEAEEAFLSCVEFQIGNGRRFSFWRDRWIQGRSVEQIAPALIPFVRPAARNLTVAAALQDNRWVAGIAGSLTVQAIAQFMELWEALSGVVLQHSEDRVRWTRTANGVYSAKTAYQAFFSNLPRETLAKDLWRAGAPLNHKLHMWFALKNRLWTADRLERRGLEHPQECALCCQEPETIEHITLHCSFSRQIWFTVLLKYRLHRFTPGTSGTISDWWTRLAAAIPKKQKKEINALILLVARCLWLERNSRVFDRFATMPTEFCRKLEVEFKLWRRAKLCGAVRE